MSEIYQQMASSMESNLTNIQQYVRQLQMQDSNSVQSPQLQKLETIVDSLTKQLHQKVEDTEAIKGSGTKW